MKKLFRWFALSLLVGAMAFAGLGGPAGADDDVPEAPAEETEEGWGPCGYYKNNGTSIPVVSYCKPCTSGPFVTVNFGGTEVLVCSGL